MNAFWKYLRFPLALVLGAMSLILGFYLALLLSRLTQTLNAFGGSAIELAALAILIAFFIWCIFVLFRRPRPRPRSKLRWCLNILAVAVVAFCCVEAVPLLTVMPIFVFLWMRANPGPFDRPRMEHIVEQVRQQDFKGEQEFILDAAGNLKKFDDHSDQDALYNASTARPFIDASRAGDGTLSLTILTSYLNHVGYYGFAYSDKILQPEPSPDTGDPTPIMDVPGMIKVPTPKGKIDDHWWKVQDDN